MRTSIVAVATLIASLVSVAACSQREVEPVGSDRAAICNAGGGGGGGGCVDDGTGCPAECSTCFRSLGEKIELRNKWMCDTETGGGGGGGCQYNYQCPTGKVCQNGTCGYPRGGCSDTQIQAAIAQCRRECDDHAETNCHDEVPTSQVCTASNGIHGCEIVGGAPSYSCANTFVPCP
ncbi:MAG: hypothetical protein JNL38_07820 [Myxococcales bacterium]|nr:hypothetical protein [Myxococcales bacterium]